MTVATVPTNAAVSQPLALLGGPPAIDPEAVPDDLFAWPIITEEEEQAVLAVLHSGQMSGFDITKQFEAEFSEWQGVDYALAHNTGTGAIQAALYALGVRKGDEVVCQSTTYWASAAPALSLGATVRFADIDSETLCIDPVDLERRLTPRTKVVIVVHYCGHPSDMDAILAITKPRGIFVLEDVSHAHGGLYHGRKLGTFGAAAAMSVMSGKALPAGEGGLMVTADHGVYERALAWGHYSRGERELTDPGLVRTSGIPLGGYKYRMQQLNAAIGRVQLRYFDDRESEIRAAMNRFWDLLADCPGLRAHRVDEDTGSTMGGWYNPHGLYVTEELGGLSLSAFLTALDAEGVRLGAGINLPLHLHPLFRDVDVYGSGGATNLTVTNDLPVAESAYARTFHVPWFKHDRAEFIDRYAMAFRKVVGHADELRASDAGNPRGYGMWPALAPERRS